MMAAQQPPPSTDPEAVTSTDIGPFVPRRTKDADGAGANLLRQYLCKESELFNKLHERREEGWNNPAGDKFFDKQRKNADEADGQTQSKFYGIMLRIGSEMAQMTGALSSINGQPIRNILDLCMAPGGYTSNALRINEEAYACGITLPMNEGGHDLVVAREDLNKDRIKDVVYQDITMYVPYIDGLPMSVPKDHPDTSKFVLRRPFEDQKFDLIFCDGQLLRTQRLGDHRASGMKGEAERLSLSQLIIAIERVSLGGTIIMLLHNPDRYPSAKLLSQFDSFSNVQLFKPEASHRHRGSFYMIAQNIRECIEKDKALTEWRAAWKMWTFDLAEGKFDALEQELDEMRGANELIKTFGKKLLKLASRVWQIQCDALGSANWVRPTPHGKGPYEKDLYGKVITPSKYDSDSRQWRREEPLLRTPQRENINPRGMGQASPQSASSDNFNPRSRRLSSSQMPRSENTSTRYRGLSVPQVQPTNSNSNYGGSMGFFGRTPGPEGNDGGIDRQMGRMQLSDNNRTRRKSGRVPPSFLMKNWRSKTCNDTQPNEEARPEKEETQ